MSLSSRYISRSLLSISKRFLTSKQLEYAERGDPTKVVQLKIRELSDDVDSKKVRVRWLAAPVNPADINQIQGVYPVKPPLPAVGGNEGVGEIDAVGSEIVGLKKGDRVFIIHSGAGTWTQYSICDESDLVNPPTAYRMLTDFVDLKPGDLVVQNGASSNVGRAVIQIARARGLHTVNVIRKSERSSDTANELIELGADEVYTEDEMLTKMRGKIKNAKLALNCVGGRSTLSLASCLGRKGVMVTYGGMSKQPLQIPTGPLIFKDIVLKGFWVTDWYRSAQKEVKVEIIFI
uniref:Enoyl-[acyl-carrier-protein] reductase, mitochondrial n=1 Tax=Syphacia muris TaxID=451379 RepID=A0A0N5AKX7_9BILA